MLCPLRGPQHFKKPNDTECKYKKFQRLRFSNGNQAETGRSAWKA